MSGIPRIVPAGTPAEPEPEDFRAPDEAPDSLIVRLRVRAAQAAKPRTIDLPVPGFGGELVIRFGTMDVATLDRLLAERNKGNASTVNESIDAMAQACVGVFGRDGDEL